MRRLDLATGDWVQLRSGSYAKITGHDSWSIKYTVAVLNGFNQVKSFHDEKSVNIDGRANTNSVPTDDDIFAFVDWDFERSLLDILLLRGNKSVHHPLKYVD